MDVEGISELGSGSLRGGAGAGREGVPRGGAYIYFRLIRVAVWQNPTCIIYMLTQNVLVVKW